LRHFPKIKEDWEMVTDVQVKTLWDWLRKGKPLALAAEKARMDRKTASKYRRDQTLPSQMRAERSWRTRPDPFVEVWPEVKELLASQPGLEAKTIFDWLQQEHPGKFPDGQLRSFQRHVKRWRATEGPPCEVFFPQEHDPGELSSSDFTHMDDLEITIAGQPFSHMLYHFVLTYSNWETATICFSESFESLSHGLQGALWELGGVPRRHRTDRLSAAVQNPSDRQELTERYQRLTEHYCIEGERTNPRSPNENGDVEQSHRRLKEAVDQALMLRGSRAFENVEAYQMFLRRLLDQRNSNRVERLAEERRRLAPLPANRLDHCKRLKASVNKCSLIHVDRNVYSVPSRLIGETLDVVVDMNWVDVRYAQQLVERIPRLRGRGKSHVNYRHVIDWLVRKPGAFENYRYQADLFPTTRFRMAYDSLVQENRSSASKIYLSILHLAARENEQRVDDALRSLLDSALPITVEAVQALITSGDTVPVVTEIVIEPARLHDFDSLFSSMEVWTHDDQGDRNVDSTTQGIAFAGHPGAI
jgi:hypothetical protein